MDDHKPNPIASEMDSKGSKINVANTKIVARKKIPIVMTPIFNVEESRKVFSSAVSNALSKVHDQVKAVPIGPAATNKNKIIPLAKSHFVDTIVEPFRLQLANPYPNPQHKSQQPPQQATVSASTASAAIVTPAVQSNPKEKIIPLLLPFPSGQITIRTSRPSEHAVNSIPSIKQSETIAPHVTAARTKVVTVPSERLSSRDSPLSLTLEGSGNSSGSDDTAKNVPKEVLSEIGAAVPAGSSSWKQLEKQYSRVQSTLGVNHMPKELSTALKEFKQWQLENDPDNTMSKQLLNGKLNEFIGKYVKPRRGMNSQLQRKSAPSTDSETDVEMAQQSKRHSLISIDPLTRMPVTTISNKTSPDPNTENVKMEELPVSKRKDSDHDSLYHLLRQDATKHLIKRKAALSGLQSKSNCSSTSSSTSSLSSSSVQILNGKLSDPKGPIRLLDKSVLAPLPQPQQMLLAHVIPNASTTSIKPNPSALNVGVPSKPKSKVARDSTDFQENHQKILALQDKIPPSDKLIRTLARLKNSARRTAGGRSKSFSASGIFATQPTKMRFKIGGSKSKSRRMRLSAKNIARQSNLIDKLSAPHFPHYIKRSTSPQQLSSSSNDDGPSSVEHRTTFKENAQQSGRDHTENVTDLMRSILWNEKNGQGNLMHMAVRLKRNEFGMLEVSDERTDESTRTEEPRNYGKRLKSLKSESKEGIGCMSSSESGMTCGHKDFDECFDAVIARIQNGAIESSVINERKPHEYYSNEIKEFIMSMVRKSDHHCNLIKAKEIIDAIGGVPRATLDLKMNDEASDAFDWSQFIAEHNGSVDESKHLQLAHDSLFDNPIPSGGNPFSIGDKLEVIDPQNCALFCICSVVGLCGHRIKLHFDGYHSSYDFWTNADSVDLFHAGWCNRTGRELQWPHRRIGNSRETTFDWEEYLRTANAREAPRSCFTHLNSVVTNKNPFKIGMKLEADDIKFTRKICVATIGDVIDSRILITFDGFDETSNYWAEITSPYIHPVNWHKENGYSITSPPGWSRDTFEWQTYLRMNRAEGVPEHSFCTRNPISFKVGMAVEIVDKKNPSLIRPATIVMVDEYEIKVLFIGWPDSYAYWVDDDSPDVHPPNWARRTGHPIENIPCKMKSSQGCPFEGCRGIGNAKKPELGKHTQLSDCPYEMKNWLSDERTDRPNRIERKNRTTNSGFNTGASACRTRLPAAAVADMHTHVSLKPLLNPTDLAGMLPKDVEMFRRLQVSSKFLLDNAESLTPLHDKWQAKLQDQNMVRLSAAAKNPLNWTVDEVAEFVSRLPHCSTLGSVFIEHGIDGMAFLSLRQHDMMNIMGLSFGSTIKVFNRIIYLRQECNAHYIIYD